jgi:hypothetical protein
MPATAGFLLVIGLGNAVHGESSDLQERKAEFDRERIAAIREFFEVGRTQTRKRIQQAFSDASLGPATHRHTLEALPNANLELRLDAFRAYVDRINDVDSAYVLVGLLSELYESTSPAERASENRPGHAQRVYDVLVGARFFSLAEELADRFGDEIVEFPYSRYSVEPLPARFPVYFVDRNRNLGTASLAVGRDEWLIGSVSPGCAFSVRALRFIEDNFDELESLLPENTAWIATQRLTYLLPQLEAFNRQFKRLGIRVSADDQRWPDQMALDITPVFYRVKDGRVIERLTGWSGDDASERFVEFLRGFSGVSIDQEGGLE